MMAKTPSEIVAKGNQPHSGMNDKALKRKLMIERRIPAVAPSYFYLYANLFPISLRGAFGLPY